MSTPGRGRGEGKLPTIEQLTGVPARAPGPAQPPVMDAEAPADPGSPHGSASGSGSGEQTVRGRGGFRLVELRTIPEGITNTHASKEAKGQPVDVVANFVRIEPMQASIVIQYRVDFEPNIESVKLRGRLFMTATKDLFTNNVTFDGMSDARSSHKLPDQETIKMVENPQEPSENVKITIKNVGTVTWGSFEMIRLYNMHMKQFLKALGFFAVSKTGCYVHESLSNTIGQTGLVTVRGFRTAANIHENGSVLMNLESTHKLMQRDNVLQTMVSIRNNLRGSGNLQQALKSQLTGKLVVTNYNKIVYRIEDVNFTLNPDKTFFDRRNNKDITYAEYYRTRYNVEITDMKQPLLLAIQNNQRKIQENENPKDIYLIPELCNIAGLTESQRADGRLKIDLIRASQIPPKDRVEHLLTFLRQMNDNSEVRASLQRWGYSYPSRPILMKARVQDREQVGMGQAALGPPDRYARVEGDGSFEKIMIKEKVAKAAPFFRLAIIIGRTDLQYEKHIRDKLKSGLERVGVHPSNVDFVRMQDGDTANHYVREIRGLSGDTTAAIVLMPHQNKERYDAIKKQASVERGLITQVVTSKLLLDDRRSSGAVVKIGIQIAAKLGGEPWYINLPLHSMMVCGYDTYHDTANRGRSFGAFTASMNSKFSRWFSRADYHDRLEELSSHMTENLSIALKRYHELNSKWPDRVMIYRDGVGDGQLEHVFKVEVKQIKKAVQACDKQIRITFIVVNKRIGARFYLKEGNTFSNPPPGTVIDDVVTRQERFDFYLISQSTRNGTVTPTYYNILHDESGLPADKLQLISFKMCFMYYNWTGTVRVPAPCQYAHKLALLCGEHLHAVPHSGLDDRLHYL